MSDLIERGRTARHFVLGGLSGPKPDAEHHPECPGCLCQQLADALEQAEKDRDALALDNAELLSQGAARSKALEQAEQGSHFCETVEEGWRPCPAALCEAERLYHKGESNE
jgi:hypothetical protein